MRRLRLTVFVRLLLILVGAASLPTALVIVLQGRVLERDLERAAARRLDRAQHAAQRLLDAHLAGLTERYRAVSGTPQFRATLELGDTATLRYYAGELASREGADAIAFVSASGDGVVAGPEPGRIETARDAGLAPVFAVDGHLFALGRVSLRTGGTDVGTLLVVEPISKARLAEWSGTCGAELAVLRDPTPAIDHLVRTVRDFGVWRLTMTSSLEDERLALARARRNLLAAGGAALGLALLACVFVSRGWVRPILDMQRAAEGIGRGEFHGRVGSRRNDEIGDVARAFDAMTVRLRAYRAQVEEQQRALEAKVGELRLSRERLSSAQRLARMGSWRLDPETGGVELSRELVALLSLPGEGRARFKDLLQRVHPDDRHGLERASRRCFAEGTSLHVDHRVILDDGTERIVQTQAQVVRDLDGGHVVLEGTVQDVTDRKRAEEQVRFLAYHDGLTSLGNRRLFKERLDMAVSQARRLGTGFGVLFLDLDHFKRINDTLGHSVGDQLLKGVADRLVVSVRETDVVARAELDTAVSRFGGDEFTILIGQLARGGDLAKVARRLLASLSRPFSLQGHEIVITCSIGIAAWPGDGQDGEVLLRNADAAMYHAKAQGRNNYQFYTASMNEEALQRLMLESRLRRALAREEFEIHYQPRLDRHGDRVLGLEALARWRDPEHGMVLPGQFIPIAEETGLIVDLGDLVLRRACMDLRGFVAAGMPRAPVSVNLSAQQFRSGDLAERIAGILEETRLPPALLELEITESMLLHDEATVVAALRELQNRGVRVTVDDFGQGYSSLAYLRNLPVDALKIDRSFVSGIADREEDAALTAAILAMGHALSLRVVAEGVEIEAQRRLLSAWGCDELQGFLFAHPMPAVEVVSWWRARRD